MSVPKGHLELLKKVSHSCTTLFILDQGLIQAGPGLKAKEKTRISHDGGLGVGLGAEAHNLGPKCATWGRSVRLGTISSFLN